MNNEKINFFRCYLGNIPCFIPVPFSYYYHVYLTIYYAAVLKLIKMIHCWRKKGFLIVKHTYIIQHYPKRFKLYC